MRPTIPLADWRIAVDLEGVRQLRELIPPPPCDWTCPWCRNWARAYASALPDAVVAQVRRLGIDPARPADLYAYEAVDQATRRAPTRVTFHTVGRILGGPPSSSVARLGSVRPYVPLASEAHEPSPGLSVAYEKDVAGTPPWADALPGPLVQVDFRLPVAWMLAEPYPSHPSDSRPG